MRPCAGHSSGPNEFMVSHLSETSNFVALSTVPSAEPVVVDEGLAPGPTVFASMFVSVSVIGLVV